MTRIQPAIFIDRQMNDATWRKGLSLDDASWQFSPLQLHRQHQEAIMSAASFSDDARKLKPDDYHAKPDLISTIAFGFIDTNLKPSKIRNDMRHWLATALSRSKFAAYGDWAPIDPNNPPRLIPDDYFRHGEINWAKSLLKMGSTEVFAIKVFRLAWVKSGKIIVRQQADRDQSKPMGRPTRAREINTIIEALAAKNMKLLQLPPKQRREEIRRQVIAISQPIEGKPEDWGLSDQVIDRAVAQHFKKNPKV